MPKLYWYIFIWFQLLFFAILPFISDLIHYLNPVALFVVWFCYTLFLLYILLSINKNKIVLKPWFFHCLYGIYSLCLFILLFFRPNNQSYENYNLVPFKTIMFYFSGQVPWLVAFYNLAANVLLFVPYGFLIQYSMSWSNSKKIYIPILGIMGIELLQYTSGRGSLDIDDLILNFIGILMGYFLQPYLARVLIVSEYSKGSSFK